MSQPPPDPARIQELVAECLDRMVEEGDGALVKVCDEHPEMAREIEHRVRLLQRVGMVQLGGSGQSAEDTEIPERLGDFRLLRLLGRGGMGVVYLAEEESLGRQVALKVVRPDEMYFPGARARFRREVESVAKLQHPNIVPVYAVGESEDIPWFSMEYVDGLPLAEVCDRLRKKRNSERSGELRGRNVYRLLADVSASGEQSRVRQSGEVRESGELIPALFAGSYVETCFRIVERVALALEHAHERGVLHRDVKPSNVLLTADGRVLLVDFGLAIGAQDVRLTRTGSAFGSLPYMAPEQIESREVDARTDVYGLGVLLFELLALRPPFDPDTQTDLRQSILVGEMPSLRGLNPALPVDGETVCVKAMDRDPTRRYATMAEFRADLEHFLLRRPIRAKRMGPWLRLRRLCQRHPVAATATAMGILLVVGTPVAVALGIARERDEALMAKAEAVRERNRADTEAEASAKSADLAAARAYRANLLAADLQIGRGQFVAARQMLDDCAEAERGFEWYQLHRRAEVASEVLVKNFTGYGIRRLVSPDGQRMLIQQGRDLSLYDFRERAVTHKLIENEDFMSSGFLPDGQIAAVCNGDVILLDGKTGKETRRLSKVRQDAIEFEIVNVSERSIGAVVARDRDAATRRDFPMVVGIDPSTSTLTEPWAPTQPFWNFVTWSQDNSFHIAGATTRGGLMKLYREGNQEPYAQWNIPRGYKKLFTARDGSRIVVDHAQAVIVYEMATGNVVCTHRRESPVHGVAFHPTRPLVALAFQSGELRLVSLVTGVAVRSFVLEQASLGKLEWCENGRSIVAVSKDEVVLFDATSDPGLLRVNPPHAMGGVSVLGENCRVLLATPDGRGLVVSSMDGALREHDLATGLVRATYTGSRVRATAGAFLPREHALLVAFEDRTLRLYDVGIGRAKQVVELTSDVAIDRLVMQSDGAAGYGLCRDGGVVRLQLVKDGASHVAVSARASGDGKDWARGTGDVTEQGKLLVRKGDGRMFGMDADGTLAGPWADEAEVRSSGYLPVDEAWPVAANPLVAHVLERERQRMSRSGHSMLPHLTVSEGAGRVAISSFLGPLTIYSLTTGQLLFEAQLEGGAFLQSMTWSATGDWLCCGFHNGNALCWDGRRANEESHLVRGASSVQRDVQTMVDAGLSPEECAAQIAAHESWSPEIQRLAHEFERASGPWSERVEHQLYALCSVSGMGAELYDKGRATATRLSDQFPESVQWLIYRGCLSMMKRHTRAAKDDLERAVKAVPVLEWEPPLAAGFIKTLAWAGQHERARAMLEEYESMLKTSPRLRGVSLASRFLTSARGHVSNAEAGAIPPGAEMRPVEDADKD